MKKVIYVSEHINGYYNSFAIKTETDGELRLDYFSPTTFEALCDEIKILRNEGYRLKNWDSPEINSSEYDPLGLLSPLGRVEMSELEMKTNPEIPTIKDLKKMFG